MSNYTAEQAELEAFIRRAGFTYGWENLESWARRMAEQACIELRERESVRKCPECRGRGYYWLEGAPGRPENRLKCEDCNGTGKRDSAKAGVSDGWQLVPVIPTKEMLEAYRSYMPHHYFMDVSIWRAMLTAAPKPETE